MLWRIDPGSGEPLYSQLVAQVRLAVAHGELVAGDRLPTARELASSLELNMHTVLHAYQVLRDGGTLELRRGRGAVVTPAAAPDLAAVERALDVLVAAARAARLSPETTTTLVKEAMTR